MAAEMMLMTGKSERSGGSGRSAARSRPQEINQYQSYLFKLGSYGKRAMAESDFCKYLV